MNSEPPAGPPLGNAAETPDEPPQAVPVPAVAFELPPAEVLPTVTSDDGRLTLSNDTLTVRGQTFLLRELERAELTPVQWLLYYLVGGMGLAGVMIAFLNNWLRTGPAMLGMALTALLLAYGRRGTNRLRLFPLGRQQVNFALPGNTADWLRLTGELNRRIRRTHDRAAAEAAALLAAADEAMRQAALAAQQQDPNFTAFSPEPY